MKPLSLTIRSYQVGFGDAFLLSFDYPDETSRHVLIDFGTTSLPKDAPADRMLTVAKDIAQVCGNKLTAVVATHRHKDHISGFATKEDEPASGNIIRDLKPDLVLQPWTEDPELDPEATGPGAIPVNDSRMAMHVASLKGMHEVADRMREEVRRSAFLSEDSRAQIAFLGDDNISNRSAVMNLRSMGPNRFLYFGQPSGLEALLPGVETIVLGPPTADQSEKVLKQRSRDENEFWHLRALTAHAAAERGNEAESSLFDPSHVEHAGDPYPEDARWLVYRARKMQESQMLGIVRALDKAMNNTSLILLFRIGDKSLLFPGDAQIENWKYALERPELCELLKQVDVYKVGHHGSLNATPKTLWQLFAKKSPDPETPWRMDSLMSTMEGKHGSPKSKTEVPRKTLTDALREQTNLISTHEVSADELCVIKTIRF